MQLLVDPLYIGRVMMGSANVQQAHLVDAVMIELLHDAIVWVPLDSSVALVTNQQIDVIDLQVDTEHHWW